jgi:hypothetical protein
LVLFTTLHENLFSMDPYLPDMYKSAGSHQENTVNRCAGLSGQHFHDLHALFASQLGGIAVRKGHYHNSIKRRDCAVKFFATYLDDRLFDNIPGREHASFPGYEARPIVRDPTALGRKIAKLTQQMETVHNMFEE